jgi:D-beta-D-heptose 7-phosphate kinase/D-beta-D-heptose 1-phosphate adenosyltransferase
VTFTQAEALEFVSRLRAGGKTLVFTNGIFDLIHPGHVRCLEQARRLGDALVVGLNSDRSVRANKGEGRPVVPELERAEVLAALTAVDSVVIFDDDTPYAIIKALTPDVLVKGADWGEDSIVGRDLVVGRGGRVVRVPFEPGYSTTRIIHIVQKKQ